MNHGGVEVGHHHAVGHVVHHFGEYFLIVRKLCDIAVAVVVIDRNSEIALLCQTPADIFDVFMQTENFLHHQHHRKLSVFARVRAIRRDDTGHGIEMHFARHEACRVGGDGGCGNRLHQFCPTLRQ